MGKTYKHDRRSKYELIKVKPKVSKKQLYTNKRISIENHVDYGNGTY